MSTVSIVDDEFVLASVPKRLYAKTMQFVLREMEAIQRREEGEEPVAEAAQGVGLIDWTQVENMKKLRAGLSTLPIGMILMDMTAAAALDANLDDHRVTFEAVYKAAGFAESQPARSTLGTFTRILKRDFGLTSEQAPNAWPVTRTYGDLGEAFYEASPDVAQAWVQSAA